MTWLHTKGFVTSLGLIRPSNDVNHGLGSVHTWVRGPYKTGAKYPGYNKFSDEGGSASKGNAILYIATESVAERQDWFCPNEANGLTEAGLSRINKSIEAFVYCVLGAQVSVRSSILGDGGRVGEVRNEFLVLVEDAIRQPDLAKSVQRYQLAVDEVKVRLNLAVCPGTWLMPGDMTINTESTAGYNNKLKQSLVGMKLGINNDVNQGTKKSALHLMPGGRVKVAPSHPSNPIHKAAVEAQNTGSEKKKTTAPTQIINSFA